MKTWIVVKVIVAMESAQIPLNDRSATHRAARRLRDVVSWAIAEARKGAAKRQADAAKTVIAPGAAARFNIQVSHDKPPAEQPAAKKAKRQVRPEWSVVSQFVQRNK